MSAFDRLGQLHDLASEEIWPPSRLATEVRRRVRVLRRLCKGHDDRFVIAHGDTPSFFADLFAVWQAGACAVCVNPRLATGELANVIDFVDPRAVLVNDAGGANVRVPLLCTAREPAPDGAIETAPISLDDDALILFTSGTTGSPKGVLHSHRSIRARVALNFAHIGHAAMRRTLCVLPTHFGHGLIGNALTPLLAGADLFLWPGLGVAGTHRLGEVIAQHSIGFMSSVPSFWRLVLKASRPPSPGTLQRVHIGSAPLSATLWAEVVAWAGTDAVANMYGTTETANWIGGVSAAETIPKDGLLGRPWGGQVAVLGEDGQPTMKGEGEIVVQSPSLMTGYFRRPDLTAQVMQDGWYRTGDHGRIDTDGLLHMTGRRHDVINRGGFKIYPEELDLLFERHAAVHEACAFALPDTVAGEGVAVAVRLRVGATATARELAAWARGHIRDQAQPDRIFIVAELPRTEQGKLDRVRAADGCLARRA